MATNNRGVDYADLWRIMKENPYYRTQILHWMQLHKLDNLSWKTQLEVLENAPLADPEIKKHFHLLHPKAKRALGLEETKKSVLRKEIFSYL